MTFPAYVVSPFYAPSCPDGGQPLVQAFGVLRIVPRPGDGPEIQDRSVAVAPGEPRAADKLARQICDVLHEPLPIIGWQILPYLIPCMDHLAGQASPTAALPLARALQTCLGLGAHDAAIPYGGAARAITSVPGGPSGIENFFDLSQEEQRGALRSFVAQECRAIFSAFFANTEGTTHA